MKAAQARFEQYLERRFGQTMTRKHYQSDLNIFIDTIGDKQPEAITATDIDHFIDQQRAAELKPSTINRRLATLHSFFEYLASEKPEVVWPNPVNWRRHHLKVGHHLPRDVADEEVKRLFAVIDDERDQAIFGLMVDAGLRVGEVVTLGLNNLERPSEAGQLAKLRVKGKGNKERLVWLTETLWAVLQQWLQVRPEVESQHLFLNQRGKPLSVSGVQYRLKQYTQAAEVSLSCHRLRHTFARRLAEHGMPIDSLAKLLGHNQLHTTQRYIDGADPTVRTDFAQAMAHLTPPTAAAEEANLAAPHPFSAPSQRPPASPEKLAKLRDQLTDLPAWLGEGVELYLSWHWPTWRARLAYQRGNDLIGLVRRVWSWLARHRQIEGWQSFGRADLTAWLKARSQDPVRRVTIRNELAHLRSLFQFLEARDWPIDPGFFRIEPPKAETAPLPRYLAEPDYRRLEKTVLGQTKGETYHAAFDRAWFLTLAHTGLRLSELLDLRLSDLNLGAGSVTVRGGKPGRDRVVYLTPTLIKALQAYLSQRPLLLENDHLFVIKDRSPCAHTIRLRLKRYGQQAGVTVTPHQLRHTFATRLLNQGMPLVSLSKLLGHQRLDQTQHYARLYDATLYEHFTQTMARLEAIPVEDWPGLDLSQSALARSETLGGANG